MACGKSLRDAHEQCIKMARILGGRVRIKLSLTLTLPITHENEFFMLQTNSMLCIVQGISVWRNKQLSIRGGSQVNGTFVHLAPSSYVCYLQIALIRGRRVCQAA